MDSRKIIGFGKSSAVVTLPKEWMTKNNVEKGSSLYFREEGDKLILSSEKISNIRLPKKKVIDANNKEINTIRREIIGAYLNAYGLIEVKAIDLSKKANEVKDILHNLMALEVMEQTKNIIVAKDFLKIEDISFDDIIGRMHRITQSILKESQSELTEDHYESIIEKDVDVDRLFYLIHRAVIYALDDPQIRKKMNKNPVELMNDWLLVSNIEHISDNAKGIARQLRKTKLPKTEMKNIKKIYSSISEEYSRVMEGYIKMDKKLADEVSDIAKKNIKLCEEFHKKNQNHMISEVIEKMRLMQIQIRYIARIILNKE